MRNILISLILGGWEMYRKDTASWIKHMDFILIDIICLQLSFIIAFYLSNIGLSPYENELYRNMAIALIGIDIILMTVLNTTKNVLKRDLVSEIKVTLKHGIILGLLAVSCLFILQKGETYSRLCLILNVILYISLSGIFRCIWKKYLKKGMEEGKNTSLLIVTSQYNLEETISNIRANNYARYILAGIAVADKDMVGQKINGVQIVANKETLVNYVCQNWIDEVLLIFSSDQNCISEQIDTLIQTGVVIHQNIPNTSNTEEGKKFIEKIGGYTVLTTSINYASTKDLLLKRLIDIIGGLIGCAITGILFLFVAPLIYFSSPGPIIFKQERVGKNGKRFQLYKFRSMYLDAENRRAELMENNKLGDGKMFKIDFDPRVIGNKILPDGTRKTGIGEFIRKTSIDEFPQFFNVLKGDMSLVGTRPPLISETQLYEIHHRARLAIKPGITGLWQVSGRSNITDFEKVVQLDCDYISNWSIGLDLRILLKTVKLVVKKDGAV